MYLARTTSTASAEGSTQDKGIVFTFVRGMATTREPDHHPVPYSFTQALATVLHHSRFRVFSVNGLYSHSPSIPCFCHSGARWDRTVKTTPVRTEELVSPPWTVQCVSVRQASWETGTPSRDHNSNNTLMTPEDIHYVILVECRLRLNGGAFCIYC